jgi:iron complex outermembrane receptor protein
VTAFYQKIDGYLSRFTGIAYNCPELFSTCFSSPPAPAINNTVDPTNGAFDFNYHGDATIKGIEATFDGRMTNQWDLGLSASYVRARYDDALLPCNDYAGTGVPNAVGVPRITGTGNVSYCRSNDRLSDTPDFSLTANTEVRASMGDLTPYIRALFNYRPSVFSQRDNFNYRDRELLNVFVGLRHEIAGWDFNVFARNLLGQDRITKISDGESAQSTSLGLSYQSGYRLINLTNPREFGLTGSFKF